MSSQVGIPFREFLGTILQNKYHLFLLQILAASFFIQCGTGILLTLDFTPTSSPVLDSKGQIQGIIKTQSLLLDEEGDTLAKPGEYFLRNEQSGDIVPARAFVNSAKISNYFHRKALHAIHTWNTHVLILLMLVIPFGIAFTFSNLHKAHILWILWWLICSVVLGIAWTGYILPWTSYSATSFAVVTGFLSKSFDGFGGYTMTTILGKNSTDMIARIFSLHAITLPTLAIILTVYIAKTSGVKNFIKPILQIISFVLIGMIPLAYLGNNLLESTIPADTFIPTLTSAKPVWFFMPFHAISNSLSIDIAGFGIVVFLFALLFIPAIKKKRNVQLFIASFLFIIIMMSFIYS